MDDLLKIIEGCRIDDRKSQDLLYKRYSSMLFGLCLRYANNRNEAEDVAQDTWVKIFNHIDSYSMDKSFEGWIRRIAVNTAITYYRKNQKFLYHQDVSEISHTPQDLENAQEQPFTQTELLNAIQTLPAGYRTVFNMYVIEGYKHKEIAEILEVDINTSKSQLSRAKKYLQRILAEMSKVNLNDGDERR